MMTAISILMPVYNSEKTILSAVRSCLRAMSDLDELIIIDDASTDTTYEKITRFVDPRIKIIRNHRNIGVAGSLNNGLSRCSRDLVGRMDADDVCLPWRFYMQRRQFQKNEVDIIFSASILDYKLGRLRILVPQIVQTLGSETTPSIKDALTVSCCVVHPTMLASRAMLNTLGGWPNVYPEDWTLWLSALESGATLRRSAVPVLLYKVSPGSESRTKAVDLQQNNALRESIQRISGAGRSNQKLSNYADKILGQYRNPIMRIFDHGLRPKAAMLGRFGYKSGPDA